MKDIDILFANEQEINSLLSVEEIDFNKISILNSNMITNITRGNKGFVTFYKKEIYQQKANIADIVDTTGAGDAFAAGFLYGLTNNYNLQLCGRIGNLWGGKIVQKLGARFEPENIKDLLLDF